MNNTNVEQMLINMIEPRVKEIEVKFSNNQGLTNEDINTLLLKSQYNHINHLDLKLNEVTADVASLKGEFNELRGEFNGLRAEFNGLRAEVKAENDLLRADFKLLESNLEKKILDAINRNMQWSIGLIALLVTVLKLIDVIFAKG
jgi:uncharacterized coiled-coil DUF342 family protein